jgi:hypothetical protein
VIKCYFPSHFYFAHIPIARSEVSVLNRRGSLLQNVTRISSLIHACLSVSNALSCLSVHLKAFSFFIKSVSGIAIFEKF